MTSTLKAAIIGVGAAANSQGRKGGGHQIGYTHAEMYQRNPRCQLVAGVDINAGNLEAFRKRFDVNGGFADVGEMLAAVKPDVVSIATYVGLHRKFIEQCARGGVKLIVCEKPFLASPADVAPVRALAAETGVKIVVAHIRRYRPAFERARELVRIGAIGGLQMMYSALPGWDLSEMGSHWIDLMRFVNQDARAKWVLGQVRAGEGRGYGHCLEDHAIAYAGFENGARALLEGGEAIAGDGSWAITFVGSAGTIRVRNENVVSLETLAGSKVEDFTGIPPNGWAALGVKGEHNDWVNLWDMMLADAVAWVGGAAEPRVALESVLATLEIGHGAYVSGLLGDRVDLPLSGKALEVARWPVDLIAERKRN
jgi:predicted dehydrogenase